VLPTRAQALSSREHVPVEDIVVELDHRTSGAVEVSLFWNRRSNAVFVQVIDWADDDDFSIPVAAADALDAYRHPFAYGPRRAAVVG
jgi:hypothetical protein